MLLDTAWCTAVMQGCAKPCGKACHCVCWNALADVVHVGAAQDAFLQDVVRLYTLASLCCHNLLNGFCTTAS